jgi:hypothetical protein
MSDSFRLNRDLPQGIIGRTSCPVNRAEIQ